MIDNKRHDMLTAVGRALTMYGVDAPYKMRHESVARRQWSVMFKDKLSQWHAEFEGTFMECLDFIHEYDKPTDRPF